MVTSLSFFVHPRVHQPKVVWFTIIYDKEHKIFPIMKLELANVRCICFKIWLKMKFSKWLDCWLIFLSTDRCSSPWPGRCLPIRGNGGASTTSTPPSPSSVNSSPPILPKRSWARMRSCVWPCATSTSWCSCWRARAVSRPATPPLLCSPFSEEIWSNCTPLLTPGPWPVTQKSPHLDPAATAPRPGRTTATCTH